MDNPKQKSDDTHRDGPVVSLQKRVAELEKQVAELLRKQKP